jgi:hypothetical protein
VHADCARTIATRTLTAAAQLTWTFSVWPAASPPGTAFDCSSAAAGIRARTATAASENSSRLRLSSPPQTMNISPPRPRLRAAIALRLIASKQLQLSPQAERRTANGERRTANAVPSAIVY